MREDFKEFINYVIGFNKLETDNDKLVVVIDCRLQKIFIKDQNNKQLGVATFSEHEKWCKEQDEKKAIRARLLANLFSGGEDD